eukprot:6807227-Prymnesium_polylepis.1
MDAVDKTLRKLVVRHRPVDLYHSLSVLRLGARNLAQDHNDLAEDHSDEYLPKDHDEDGQLLHAVRVSHPCVAKQRRDRRQQETCVECREVLAPVAGNGNAVVGSLVSIQPIQLLHQRLRAIAVTDGVAARRGVVDSRANENEHHQER